MMNTDTNESRATCGVPSLTHVKGHIQFSLMVEIKELHQVHEKEEGLCPIPLGHVGLCLIPLNMRTGPETGRRGLALGPTAMKHLTELRLFGKHG